MTVAMHDGSALQYLLTDHLGSAVAVTNASGTLTSQQRYLPFGGVRTVATPSPLSGTDMAFTGQRNLDVQGNASMGLMDYRARFYSSYIGRFIQPDSIIPNPGNPQAFNRYSYVDNDPINFSDPTGHCIQEGDAPPGSISNRNICLGMRDAVELNDKAEKLIDFAEGVGMTPEDVIAIGLGHEMAGADADYMEKFKQHVYNRFIWFARQFCKGRLTHNCMLNFYGVEYQSVFTFLDIPKYQAGAHPELFAREQGAPYWDKRYIDAGRDIVAGFWSSLNPAFDPENTPEDRDKPFDTGVYTVAEVEQILGGPPTKEAGFVGIMPAACPGSGARGYVLIMTYDAWTLLDSIRVC